MPHTLRAFCSLAVLLSAVGGASADLIRYTFTGTDSSTGAPVTGSFSYDDSVRPLGPGGSFFQDVRGNVTITAGGKTYSSNHVTAGVEADGLLLFAYNPDDGHIGSLLKLYLLSNGSAPPFPNTNSLPGSLDPTALRRSMFVVGRNFVAVGGANNPTGVQPAFGEQPISGPITDFQPIVSDAALSPEPGGLVLAMLGAAVVAGQTLGRQRQAARRT